jgi:DUF971 family protein
VAAFGSRSGRPHGEAFAAAYNDRVNAASIPIASPTSIHADRAAGRLEIAWADGHETVFDSVSLRWLCPCAFCRGEAGQPGWLDTKPTLTPDQTRIVDVHLVGGYAIAPEWGDGHHTGFYTFRLLREQCPCPDCAARRAGHRHDLPHEGDER